MPRFHFNIFDGETRIDETGTELPDWQTAQTQAIQTAGAIIRDRAISMRLGEDWRMEVTEGDGLILFASIKRSKPPQWAAPFFPLGGR